MQQTPATGTYRSGPDQPYQDDNDDEDREVHWEGTGPNQKVSTLPNYDDDEEDEEDEVEDEDIEEEDDDDADDSDVHQYGHRARMYNAQGRAPYPKMI